jgi:DNA-binding helix-hairpin-helix protein with protein kinase domain
VRDAEVLRRQFAFVRRLDLGGLHVAKPIAVLKPPYVGYVAEFLGDMVPIKSLMEAPSKDLVRWHIDTGSLRRRLRLLAHAGEALLGLHARGVVYADVSHNNVFVSEPVSAVEAWLIDLDNLSHDSDPRHAIYTPGYGAPEVVAGGSGCTSLSDAWGFAVLAWHTLTLHHPFIGDFVNDGAPELEEQALAGHLPWVGHSTDDRNRCSTGLPADLVLAGRLMDLAKRTFEDGVIDRKLRASISDWVERLHVAADQTVSCPAARGPTSSRRRSARGATSRAR